MKRRFDTAAELAAAWEEYKDYCDGKDIALSVFNKKEGRFVTERVKRPVAYSVEGFCVYAGIARSAFYSTYRDADEFSETVALMKDECEVDAREKFEQGVLPTQLAPLWMSRYGYGKIENVVTSEKVVIMDDV